MQINTNSYAGFLNKIDSDNDDSNSNGIFYPIVFSTIFYSKIIQELVFTLSSYFTINTTIINCK